MVALLVPEGRSVVQEGELKTPTAEQFVATVILDGRYLNDFKRLPEGVAKRMGIALEPRIVEEIRTKPGDETEMLRETLDKMTGELARKVALEDMHVTTPVLGVGTAIGIIGLAIAAVTVVTAATGETHTDPEMEIIDISPYAGSKL